MDQFEAMDPKLPIMNGSSTNLNYTPWDVPFDPVMWPVIPSSSSPSSSLQTQVQIQDQNQQMISGVNPAAEAQVEEEEEEEEPLGPMKEMMFKMASMQPVDIDPASVRKPKRRNVRISEDPQSVAARHRREKISEKIRILQRLVPGGTKMDTASMLDEAVRYVKFLKRQIRQLQAAAAANPAAVQFPFPPPPSSSHFG